MDISSANAIITITAPGVFNTPQRLQKFSAENIYEMGAIETGEFQMGVDGYLAAGKIFVMKEQSYTFLPSSDSVAVFNQINRFEDTNIVKIPLQGLTILPSIGLQFVSPLGYLKTFTPMPPGGKVLGPMKYSIVWEKVLPQPA